MIVVLVLVIAIAVVTAVVVLLQASQNATLGGSYQYADWGGQTPNASGQLNTQVGGPGAQIAPKAKRYTEKYSFYLFTDPNEAAFTIKIPTSWQVLNGSGLIRPYIDAGIMVGAYSLNNQGFIYVSPVADYTIPNALLDYAGFTEGTYYDVSGGLARPMLVKRYTNARDYLDEYLDQLDVETRVVEVVDRPDLLSADPGPLITQQSAAEITYISGSGVNELTNKVIAYNYLVQSGGMGIWGASMFGYSSPDSLFNETEYLVLKSAESFKVDANWAKREAQEMNERMGIISATQDSVSETIASTFDYRSETMDEINDEWSKAVLGVEEVYTDTGDMYIVDSGSKYYWIDNQGNIYGTDTYESPLPQENLELMQCPGCNE